MTRSLWGGLFAFVVLFIFYQLPEGIGIHLLKSPSVQAALLLVFYPIAFLVARSLGFRGFDSYAMSLHRGWARNLVLTLLLAWCAKAAAVIVGLRLGVYRYIAPSQSIAQLLSAWFVIAFTTFFPSVAEDIVTRGFWYRQAPWLGHGALFVLFSSTLYVLNHIYRLSNGPLEWLMLFAFGLAYATALVRTGSLWATIGLHWGWNMAAFAAGSMFEVVEGRESHAPLLSAGAHLGVACVILVLSPVLAKNFVTEALPASRRASDESV